MIKMLTFDRVGISSERGFTFPEILVAVGIMAVLFGIGTVTLLRAQRRPLLDATALTLVVDSKNQQTKAMVGDTQAASSPSNYGVFFNANSYTLFKGLVYSPSDPANFVVNLDSSLRFVNINFVSSTLAFAVGNGDVANYSLGADSVTIQNTDNGEIVTVTVNQYGAVSIN